MCNVATRTLIGVLAFAGLVMTGGVATAATFTVNAPGGQSDCDLADGLCASAVCIGGSSAGYACAEACVGCCPGGACGCGPCTLRAALEQMSSMSGPHLVEFSISEVTSDVEIPGFAWSQSLVAPRNVTIDGTSSPTGSVWIRPSHQLPTDTLLELSGNSRVRGLVLSGFDASGIGLSGGNNTVEQVVIGLDPSGTPSEKEIITGIRAGGSDNRIGGVGVGNVIANASQGILVSGTRNHVVGNVIGANVDGSHSNLHFLVGGGISVSSSDNVIGGSEPGEGNLIANWAFEAIHVQGNGNRIRGNTLGTDRAAKRALTIGAIGIEIFGTGNVVGGEANATGTPGNLIVTNNGGEGDAGVVIVASDNAVQRNTILGVAELPLRDDLVPSPSAGVYIVGSRNRVGGDQPGEGNLFAGGSSGVVVHSGHDNSILANAIVRSGSGISVGSDANRMQAAPRLADAGGNLRGDPNTTFRVELFANEGCAPPWLPSNRDAGRFLGALAVSTDGAGEASFELPDVPYLTATATGPTGSTSELSNCFVGTCRTAGTVEAEPASGDDIWANGREWGRLKVVVRDPSGQPIAGAALLVATEPEEKVEVDVPPGGFRTDGSGELEVKVRSTRVGLVTVRIQSVAGRLCPGSAVVRFAERRVAVIIRGIRSQLGRDSEGTEFPAVRKVFKRKGFARPVVAEAPEGDSECGDAEDDDNDGSVDDGCPLVLDYSYRGGETLPISGTWSPNPYRCEDTSQPLRKSHKRLAQMLNRFGRANPNSRFVVFGYSQGGLIALSALQRQKYGKSVLDSVISFDGVLGGTPPLDTTVLDQLVCWGGRAKDDLVELWNSTAEHERQGSTATAFGVRNDDLVQDAMERGIRVLTVGSRHDCIFNPGLCFSGAAMANNESSQVIETAMQRLVSIPSAPCFGCFSSSHEKILTNRKALKTLRKFLE